ncbi:MAG: hypothetical protein JWP85_2725 [Rhodoglobus sp.]|nr:hypothetical protein [Rhodoglobus sp.]
MGKGQPDLGMEAADHLTDPFDAMHRASHHIISATLIPELAMTLLPRILRAVTPTIFAVALAPSFSFAAGAPAAALNKTVSLSFQSSGIARPVSGGAEYGFNTLVSRTIYISSEGRLFMRAGQKSGRGPASASKEIAPDSGGGSFHFQGNSIVGVMPFASGARQVTMAFDSSFSSCTASTVEGRNAGATIRRKAPNGVVVGILSSKDSLPSCSVQSGNAFAH